MDKSLPTPDKNLQIITKEKILLFAPNIVGYFRITFLIISFVFFYSNPILFMIFYGASYILDFVDGMLARRFHQCSRFGALLDMMTDRCATISMLVLLGHLYGSYYLCFFVFNGILDMVSHWYQMYTCVLIGASTHKAGDKNETFLVRIYYMKYFLFTCVLGAELTSILFYLKIQMPDLYRITPVIQYIHYCAFAIFSYKQMISVFQLKKSLSRLLDIDLNKEDRARIASGHS